MSAHWVIDWKKIQSIDDLKVLLSCCDLRPRPLHPDFETLRPLCKLIDEDGREVKDAEVEPSLP